MNRDLWKQALSEDSTPKWKCPRCGKGILVLEKDSLHSLETAESRRDRQRPDWHPMHVMFRFTVLLRCNACKDSVAVAGLGGPEPTYDPNGGSSWEERYAPRYISPPPEMIQIPNKCPNVVQEHLRRAFRLFWSDPDAAATAYAQHSNI